MEIRAERHFRDLFVDIYSVPQFGGPDSSMIRVFRRERDAHRLSKGRGEVRLGNFTWGVLFYLFYVMVCLFSVHIAVSKWGRVEQSDRQFYFSQVFMEFCYFLFLLNTVVFLFR